MKRGAVGSPCPTAVRTPSVPAVAIVPMVPVEWAAVTGWPMIIAMTTPVVAVIVAAVIVNVVTAVIAAVVVTVIVPVVTAVITVSWVIGITFPRLHVQRYRVDLGTFAHIEPPLAVVITGGGNVVVTRSQFRPRRIVAADSQQGVATIAVVIRRGVNNDARQVVVIRIEPGVLLQLAFDVEFAVAIHIDVDTIRLLSAAVVVTCSSMAGDSQENQREQQLATGAEDPV